MPRLRRIFLPQGPRIAAGARSTNLLEEIPPMNRRRRIATAFSFLLPLVSLTFCSTNSIAADRTESSAQTFLGNHALRVATGGAPEEISQAAPSGTHLFKLPVKYATGGYSPYAVAIADVNEDGRPDVVAANQEMYGTESSVSVLLGNGDGTFQPGTVFDSGGVIAYSVEVADLNHDGHLDLLVANGCASGTNCSAEGVLAVLLGNGDGTFQAAKTYDTGGSDVYHAIAMLADLNGDGNLDAVIAHGCGGITCTDGTLSVLLGDGTGAFGAATSYASGGAGASSVAIADMNGDHKLDLLTANWCSSVCSTSTPTEGSVGVLLGNGDGTFQPAVAYLSGGNGTRSIATADLNGDGKLDLVVGNWGTIDGASNKGSITVLMGTGNGSFQKTRTLLAGGNEVPSIAVADLNGDGHPDVVTADVAGTYHYNTNGSVSVFLNNLP